MLHQTKSREFLLDSQQWAAYLHQYPSHLGKEQAPPLEYPVFVLSVAVGDEQGWFHSFVTRKDVRSLCGLALPAVPSLCGLALPAVPSEFKDAKRLVGVDVETLQCLTDARGHLVELFRKDDIGDRSRFGKERVDFPPMAYLSVTKADRLRGPHEHFSQTDIFTFCRGDFEVFLWDTRQNSTTCGSRMKIEVDRNSYIRVIVPPGVVHAYRAVGQDGVTINCPDKLYRGWKKQQPVDEIRHEDGAGSPFQPW